LGYVVAGLAVVGMGINYMVARANLNKEEEAKEKVKK